MATSLALPATPPLYSASFRLESDLRTIATPSFCGGGHRARLGRHDPYGRHQSRAHSGGTPVMPAITAPADVERRVRCVEHSARLFRLSPARILRCLRARELEIAAERYVPRPGSYHASRCAHRSPHGREQAVAFPFA